ncbi:MAG TPA: saccharopine dehydrogenase NADP-binding domain-containing protein, partial [Reyranella sp.]|nr:saccharopine dehydrogenase NADP-binding domain-containing protein [Reyranella sp.]
MDSRDFDIVLYGATGFTGRLTAEHLARWSRADGAPNWAIAGRNAQKLGRLREELGAAQAAIVVASLDDRDSLQSMARRARVVANAAGPYQLYGE